MSRVPIHPEAFSKEPSHRMKRPAQKHADHLKWIRTLPCCITGSYYNVQAAHIRYGDNHYGKAQAGMSQKSHDHFVVPLSEVKHREQHGYNEEDFWFKHNNMDPLSTAVRLWSATLDTSAAEMILRTPHQRMEAIKCWST